MSKRYLVTGLPRSRTAWFSVLAGNCYHEPTRYLQSWDEMKSFWGNFGLSDHALGFQLSRILAEIEPRVLLIERGLRDVEKSLALMGIGNDATRTFLTQLQTRLNEHKKHPLVKTVAYKALNDYSVVIDCLEWVWPEGGDYSRVRDLMRMNIQVERSYIEREAGMKNSMWWRH